MDCQGYADRLAKSQVSIGFNQWRFRSCSKDRSRGLPLGWYSYWRFWKGCQCSVRNWLLTYRAQKVCSLKVFESSSKDTNRWKNSLKDLPEKQCLCVSQFTLYARLTKGSKPDFHESAPGPAALCLFEMFIKKLEGLLCLEPTTQPTINEEMSSSERSIEFIKSNQVATSDGTNAWRRVQRGAFAHRMVLDSQNDGPVTFILESRE